MKIHLSSCFLSKQKMQLLTVSQEKSNQTSELKTPTWMNQIYGYV